METELLFEARVPLHPPTDVGPTAEVRRVIFVVGAGRFAGPKLTSDVIPTSGADRSRIRSDDAGALDVRMCFEAHDDAIIFMHWHGYMFASAKNLAYALDFAKIDDPEGADGYYVRTGPVFETGDERYAWLSNIVAVGRSRTEDGGVVHRVFAVK